MYKNGNKFTRKRRKFPLIGNSLDRLQCKSGSTCSTWNWDNNLPAQWDSCIGYLLNPINKPSWIIVHVFIIMIMGSKTKGRGRTCPPIILLGDNYAYVPQQNILTNNAGKGRVISKDTYSIIPSNPGRGKGLSVQNPTLCHFQFPNCCIQKLAVHDSCSVHSCIPHPQKKV